jgi:DNA-binding SARP family transcriptional activator
LEVVDEAGEPIKLSGARQRGLLALLALHSPSMVTTDLIIDSLWGDAVARPEAALHMTVSRLRAALGDESVVTEPGGYRLDLPLTKSDINRFRSLVTRGRQLVTLGHPEKGCEGFRQALSQWRGPVLADLREFEFAEQASRQLEEERVTAVEQLMDAMLAAGEHDLVVGELFGLVEAFPYRERLWELLMRDMGRVGEVAGQPGPDSRMESVTRWTQTGNRRRSRHRRCLGRLARSHRRASNGS